MNNKPNRIYILQNIDKLSNHFHATTSFYIPTTALRTQVLSDFIPRKKSLMTSWQAAGRGAGSWFNLINNTFYKPPQLFI